MTDPDQERKGTSLPFQQSSAIRWLVRGKILSKIQLTEKSKKPISYVQRKTRADTRYKPRILHEMLSDPINYHYIHCVTHIMANFERVGAYFQSTDADPQCLVNEL